MSDWWETRYRLGTPVTVAGFPRPLYPPDAVEHGKKPSSDGPDVIAYKRTVSRAGRWPWQAFDDTYSNAFAHGRGKAVGDSGVAGVQRQMQGDATGWIGYRSFNVLRSIIIPEELPNAGEHAMDAKAVELMNQAYARFKGSEPPIFDTTIRKAALARAITQLGEKESPSGSNRQPYGQWYGMNGVPWCAIFATWSYVLGAQDIEEVSYALKRGTNYAYVPYVVADARARKNHLSTTDDPTPGDLVCYDWGFNSLYDHIGIFEKWTIPPVEFTAIEGNTSITNDSNGGEVMRRSRSRRNQGTVFVRVSEAV